MNRSEILALKCRTISKGNVKCFTILMELIDAKREDLVDEIIKLMNADYQALTAEQIVKTYDSCGGKKGFLERCNKMFNKRTLNREYSEYEYEEKLKKYACGETNEHPDGTTLDENGKEIKHD